MTAWCSAELRPRKLRLRSCCTLPSPFLSQPVHTNPSRQHHFLVLQNKRGSQLCCFVGIGDNLVCSLMVSCCCLCAVYRLKSSFLCPSPPFSHTAPCVRSILALFPSFAYLACKKWYLSTNVFIQVFFPKLTVLMRLVKCQENRFPASPGN